MRTRPAARNIVAAAFTAAIAFAVTACSHSWGHEPDQPYSSRCAAALTPLREALSSYGDSPQTRTSGAAAVTAAHDAANLHCQPAELGLFETRAVQRNEHCDAALRQLNTQISVVEPRSVAGQLWRHHTQQLTPMLQPSDTDPQQLAQQLETWAHPDCNNQETGGFLHYQTGTLLQAPPVTVSAVTALATGTAARP